MPRKSIAILIATFTLSAVLLTAALKLSGQIGGSSANDPDLPPAEALTTAIDKQEYLRLRDEYTAGLRGLEIGEAFDPTARSRAIISLEAKQEEMINVFRGAAQKAGPGSREAEAFAIMSTAWTELGPAPIPNGQTETLPTPVSGRTTAIAIHPNNPNIAYVGTAQGGLYRTLDGGATWTPMMDTAQSLAIGAVAFAPSDPSILYVGTGEANLSQDSFFGVGLYRINDAIGVSPVLTGPINPSVATGIAGTTAFTGVSISKVVVHPDNPAIVFVSTASGTSGNPSGLSVSTSVPPLSLVGLYRSMNATDAKDSVGFEKLTVTTANSLAPDNSGNRNIMDLVMEPGAPNRLICTVLGTNGSTPPDGGVYVTSDGLAPSPTFTRTLALGGASATVDANQGRAELAINKMGSTVTVYVASGESSAATAGPACGTGGTLRKSIDGGNTWTPPLPAANGFCAAQCFYDIAVAVDPTDPLGVLLGGNVTGACTKLIARSNDGGATFAPTSTGVHADNQVVVFAPSDPSVAYMGTDGGIYKSTNGGTSWTSLSNTTFRATQFQSIATHPTDRELMIGGTQDNGTLRKNTDGTWFRSDAGDGGYALIDRNATSTTNARMYHTYFNSTGSQIGWAFSNNSGGNWTFRNCPSNGISCSDNTLFYAPMALGPGNPSTLYFGTDRLYRSTDGMNMTAVSQRPLATDSVPPAAPVPQVLSTIAISPQNDNVRVVGLRNGKVFATTTGSSTLTDVSSPSFPTPNPGTIRRAVSRAAIHPYNPNIAYVTFGGYNVPAGQHVWKTTNLDTSGGAAAVSWTPAGDGIPDVPVNAIVIDRLSPNTLYAATDIGIYRSADAGATWAPFSNGLPRVAVFDIAFQEQVSTPTSERVLRIATHGRGIWEIAIPVPAGQLTNVVSRKTHAAAGVFDVDLPLTGTRGVEPRTGGANGDHSVVFTFATPVSSVGSATTSAGSVSSSGPGSDPREYIVNLTGVPNAQNVTITLNNVVDAVGSAPAPISVTMGVLFADVNGSGVVTGSDINLTKAQQSRPVTTSNFRSDVNRSGVITGSDLNLIKQNQSATINNP